MKSLKPYPLQTGRNISARILLSLTLALVGLTSLIPSPCYPASRPVPLTVSTSLDQGDTDTYGGVSPESVQKYQRIVAYMQERMQAAGVPGGAIAIVRRGRLRFAAGVGVKRQGLPDPITPDTLFRVASLTRMLTAMAVLSLADEGRLDLHRPITDYLPWLAVKPPYDASAITTHDLLTHLGAIPERVAGGCFSGPTAIGDYFRANNPLTLWGPPGRYWNYNNTGYALAGLVAEAVDGRPYDEIVRARVFEPAGMKTATFNPAAPQAADHATGHDLSSTGAITATFEPLSTDCPSHHPAGRALASIRDYSHLAEALLHKGDSALSRRSNRLMQSPLVWTRRNRDLYYGYGIELDKYKGLDLVRHNGATAGFVSEFALIPAEKDAVIVFLNGNGPGSFLPYTIRNYALDTLYELGDVPPTDYSTPPSTWNVYEGTYYDPIRWGEIRVELRGNTLWGTFVKSGWDGPFTQSQDDEFTIAPAGSGKQFAVFHREGGGKAEAMVFANSTVAERVR